MKTPFARLNQRFGLCLIQDKAGKPSSCYEGPIRPLFATLAVAFAFSLTLSAHAAIDLYETIDNTPTGTPSETGPWVPLDTGVNPGYLIFLDSGTPGYVAGLAAPPGTISDVVYFPMDPIDHRAHEVRLFSDGSPEMPTWADIQAFRDSSNSNPSYATLEGPNGITDLGIYIIHSDEDKTGVNHGAPDGGETSLLLSLAFAGLLTLRNRNRLGLTQN